MKKQRSFCFAIGHKNVPKNPNEINIPNQYATVKSAKRGKHDSRRQNKNMILLMNFLKNQLESLMHLKITMNKNVNIGQQIILSMTQEGKMSLDLIMKL